MVFNIENSLTNWVDGMKINKDHFINSENALVDLIRDSNALQITPYNFGLLPAAPGERKSFGVNILQTLGDSFRVSVSSCRAVTAGGSRIEVLPHISNEVADNLKIDRHATINEQTNVLQNAYFIVITVDPFKRLPGGKELKEQPARLKDAKPTYFLSVVSGNELSAREFGNFSFPIARLIVKNGNIMEDEHFIPPCTNILAHPNLTQTFNNIFNFLSNIQQSSIVIVQKVISKPQAAGLGNNIKNLAEKNILHISGNLFALKNLTPYRSPVFAIQFVVQLASIIKIALSFMAEKEREELLLYFKEWNDMTASSFDEMLNDVVDIEYNHYALREMFLPVEYFLSKWADLMHKVSERDPIGRRKEGDFFVRDVNYNDPKAPKKNLNWMQS